MNHNQWKLSVYNRPGKKLSSDELSHLHKELIDVARTSFEEIPFYQCLTGKKEDFDRLIIAVVRNAHGQMLGFCSSYVFDEEKFGNILHLGLTCVSPEARGLKLTHILTSKVVKTFLLKYSLFKSSWMTNVACVLSSLGNVANYFEDVYPSPFVSCPNLDQIEISKLINQKYRQEIFIPDSAVFNDKTFVFEGSTFDNVFQKQMGDKRFYHRDSSLNHFFLSMIDFERGDEVLQIGKVSLLSFPLYFIKRFKTKLLRPWTRLRKIAA